METLKAEKQAEIEQQQNRLQEVKLENRSLRKIAANYERVKRAFGTYEVEEAVKQQEQAEKTRRRPKRFLDHSR